MALFSTSLREQGTQKRVPRTQDAADQEAGGPSFPPRTQHPPRLDPMPCHPPRGAPPALPLSPASAPPLLNQPHQKAYRFYSSHILKKTQLCIDLMFFLTISLLLHKDISKSYPPRFFSSYFLPNCSFQAPTRRTPAAAHNGRSKACTVLSRGA